MKVGFIGLGTMGRPMAGHIIDGGHQLVVFDKVAPPSELAAKGATSCSSSREVAENADVVIIMVPNTPDVEAVLFAENGVAEGLSAGKTVIDMSSISPIATKEFAAKIAALAATISTRPSRVARSAPRQARSRLWSAARPRASTGSSRCST